jgi:hypothetical protein
MVKKRNPIAKELSNPKFRLRVVKSKKKRKKPKHKNKENDYGPLF